MRLRQMRQSSKDAATALPGQALQSLLEVPAGIGPAIAACRKLRQPLQRLRALEARFLALLPALNWDKACFLLEAAREAAAAVASESSRQICDRMANRFMREHLQTLELEEALQVTDAESRPAERNALLEAYAKAHQADLDEFEQTAIIERLVPAANPGCYHDDEPTAARIRQQAMLS